MGGMGGQPRARKPVDNSKLYDMLEVPKDATDADIKKAYRRAAMVHHPDKGGDADKFKDIQHAYEVLSNPDKRKLYDQGGEEAVEHGHAGGDDDMDIFSAFGGGGRRRGPPPKARGEDVVFPLTVTLEEMYNGCTKKLRLTRNILCTGCDGKGGSKVTECSGCKGQGVKVMIRQIGPGMITQQQVTCQACRGEGQVIAPGAKCRDCDGQKVTKEKKTLEVTVPKGCTHGSTHVFKGAADEAPNTIPGDVIVKFDQKPHDQMTRKGNHLFYKLNISLLEALTGFEAHIQQLDGRVLALKSNAIVRPGDYKMIVDEGMPIAASRGIDSGNMYIQFNIVFPDDSAITANVRNSLAQTLPTAPVRTTPAITGDVEQVDLLPVNMEAEEKRFAQEEEYAKQQERKQNRGQYDEDDDDDHQPRGAACQQM